jgi:hypothetical protein
VAFTIIRHNVLNDQAATQQTQVDGNSLEIGRGSGNALLLDDLHISLRGYPLKAGQLSVGHVR